MDPKEFLRRLSEVSEWHRPNLGPNGSPSISKGREKKLVPHPGAVTEAELAEMTDTEAQAYYEQLMAWREQQPNESVQPEILRVKTQATNCEDCGRHCPQGRRTECKLYETGQRHWREFCTTCELYRDPATGKFTLPKLGSHQYFSSFYRPKLGVYASKYQPKIEVVKEPQPRGRPKKEAKLTKSQIVEKIMQDGTWHIRETEDQIIRTFEPKK